MRRQIFLSKRNPKPLGSVLYYNKTFLKNLKANLAFPSLIKKVILPNQTGEKFKLYQYEPVQGAVEIGQYADYANFNESGIKTDIDDVVAEVAQEMAYKMGMTLNALVEATADPNTQIAVENYKTLDKDGDEVVELFKSMPSGGYESLGLHKAKDWSKIKS